MALRHPRSVPYLARLFLLARHGTARVGRVARGRLPDVVLLVLAVAIALVFRGWSRNQTLAALEDAGWVAVAIVFYLPLVFATGCLTAWLSLRGWRTSHTEITQGVLLGLTPREGEVAPSEVRCVVSCADGSRHEAVASPESAGGFVCHYNSGFPSTGVLPPQGAHVARWFVKESLRDGWVKVGEDLFSYDPLSASDHAQSA